MTFAGTNALADSRVYAQDTAPTDTRPGIMWVDTSQSPPRTMVYSADSGTWEPVSERPVTFTDTAETFGESDVSITHTNTKIPTGGGEIVPTSGTTQSAVTLGSVNTGSYASEEGGVIIEPKEPLAGIAAIPRTTNSTATLRVRDIDGNLLAELSGVSTGSMSGPVFYPLIPGNQYHFTVAGNGRPIEGVSYPTETPEIAVVDYSNVGASWMSSPYGIEDIAGVTLSGTPTTTVEWPNPADIYAWDAISYQRKDTGASVYIEENQSGTWTEIAGPVSRGGDIPAVAGNNVRFRVDFTDADGIEAIYRRYQV